MFKINNESELELFLKLLSEEAVKISKKTLNEKNYDDHAQERFVKSFDMDKKRFNLKEVEADTPSQEKEEPEQKEPEQKEPEQKEPEGKEEEAEKVRKDFGASIDSLERNINALRSGKSLKDSTISKELENYYNRLSDEERISLVMFVSALSNILTGEVRGDKAQDPSDPPVNIKFVVSDEPASKPEQEPEVEEPEVEAPGTTDEDEEDLSAPIKVNESQDISKIRKRLRNLMRL